MNAARTTLAVCAVVVVAVVAYHNSLSVPFLYDDEMSIPQNPTIRQLASALTPPEEAGVGGRPVLNLSYALNYAVGGASVTGYHVVNVAIHALAGLTLLGIVRRTLDPTVATVVALIWTVHPLQTEAVTYLSQRSESLMGLFYLLTVYCFIRGWPVLSVMACALGMMTKEGMVTAPVLVLLYDRTFVAGSFRAAWEKRRRLYVALAATWLVLGWLMVGLHERGAGFGAGVSWWSYALTQCRAVAQYLRLSVWPAPLIFDYGTDLVQNAGEVVPAALLLVALVSGTVMALRRWPALGFLGAWVLLTLAPTSSVVPVAGSPIAEHRMYLALASIVTLAVVGIFTIGKRSLSVALAGVVVVALTGLTIRRNLDYHSNIAIWSDTVAKGPGNARAHYNLGVALNESNLTGQVIQQYEAALQIKPDYPDAHNNLAWLLATTNDARFRDPVTAVQHAERACELTGRRDAEALDTLAAAYAAAGRFDDAINSAQSAVGLAAGRDELVRDIQTRLELYTARQPYHEAP